MNRMPLMIKQIKQEDLYHFSIEWNDGKTTYHRLAELQKNCPCTSCRDDKTGRFIKESDMISDTLMAKRIISVGNYALRIEFVSGCQSGIYTFSFLRKLAG